MSGRPEWWEVTTDVDLRDVAHDLAAVADDLADERRRHTYPKARDLIDLDVITVRSWAEEAMHSRDSGDALDRRDALALALGRRDAAELRLRRWADAGDLWNEHRLLPHRAVSGVAS